jgi:GTP-binding protein HflX
VPTGAGAKLAWLHNHGEVIDSEVGETETTLTVRLADADLARFQSQSD